jgi:hypothetical protein
VLTALAAVTVALLALTLSGTGARAQEGAGDNGPPGVVETVDFSMTVVGAGCDTVTGDTKCDVTPNAPFTLLVSLNSFVTVNSDYSQLSLRLVNSTGLVNKTAIQSVTAPVQAQGCGAQSSLSFGPTLYFFNCAVSDGSENYVGVVFDADFNCQAGSPRTFTLEQGVNVGQTRIVSSKGTAIADPDGNETLTINCVDPATLVGGAQADLTGTATSSNAAGAVAGATVAVVMALTAGLWMRVSRRRVTS